MNVDSHPPERIAKLPAWAQKFISEQESALKAKEEELKDLLAAHAILQGRTWFALPGPKPEMFNLTSPDGGRHQVHLWLLDHDHPLSVCALGPGDTLLVGRAISTDWMGGKL